MDEEHFGKESTGDVNVPYPFKSATEMLGYCKETGLSLSGMVMQNELALHSKRDRRLFCKRMADHARLYRSRMNTEGVLPGPLRVPRRASALRRMLVTTDILQRPDERGRLGEYVRSGG